MTTTLWLALNCTGDENSIIPSKSSPVKKPQENGVGLQKRTLFMGCVMQFQSQSMSMSNQFNFKVHVFYVASDFRVYSYPLIKALMKTYGFQCNHGLGQC